MALHIYQIWIEYDDRPGFHPVSVYVKRGSGNQAEQVAEFHGKKLNRPLLTAARFIAQDDEGV